MANKTCLLIKAELGGPEHHGLTPDSYRELTRNWENLINPVLEDSEWGEDTVKFKFGFKQALKQLGAMYHGKDLKALVRYIKEDYINSKDEDNEWMEPYIPAEGLENAISKKYQATVGDQNSNRYDDTKDEEDTAFLPSKFLEDTFGKDASLKNKLKQEVTHKLLNTFIIDRENGKLVANVLEANINARRHKLLLFDTVCDYIGMNRTALFDAEGNYTGAMDSAEFKSKMKSAPGGAFNTWEFSLIQSYGNNPDMKNAYNAYKAWFTLKNYDNFINLLIGSAVGVHPNAKGKLTSGNVYTFNDKSGANITSWRTDDNIMLSQEISALVQSLVTSTPLLSYGNNNPSGTYLKFEDFYRLTTKIKDLTLNSDAGTLLINRLSFMDTLNEEDKALYGRHSLRELINKIRFNPLLYTRLVFLALANDKELMEELKFTPEEQDRIYSLYKGIYSPYDLSSINYIQNLLVNGKTKMYSHNQLDYYSMLTQAADSMFTVNFLQYYENNGVITVRTLRDQAVDNGRRNIEQIIGNLNSRRIINEGFTEYHMKPWEAHPSFNKDSKAFDGINFKIGDYYFKLSKLGEKLDIFKDNKYISSNNFLSTLKSTPELLTQVLRFIDAQMGLDLTGNSNFLDALDRTFGGKTINSYMAIPSLLKLSSKILMNKYLSNKKLVDDNGTPLIGYSKNMLKLYAYYANNKDLAPKYNSNLNEINLLPDKDITVLDKIAKAKTLVTGEAQSTQVRDAEGNMLSSQTLSRLLGNITAQWEEIRLNNGACSGFSVIKPGMFLGHYASKELKATMGNKAETRFTVAELAQGAFLYDFVTGLAVAGDVNGKGVYHDGIVGFYPSVNSDKGTIGRMVMNLGMNCERFNKPYSQLTIEEIETLTSEELGTAYQKAYNNIKLDYNRLLQWLVTEKGVNINITPDDNFDTLNTWCEGIKAKPAKMIFMWTREYNNKHVDNPIRIIENVHYVKGANGGIQFNNTTRALMNRYGDPKQLRHFMDMKRTEVLTSLLSENAEFNLYSEGDSSLTTPKLYLRGDQFKDWVGILDTTASGKVIRQVDNGRMVIAKISYKGSTYSITSKADFADFAKSTKLDVTDLYKNPHKLMKGDLHITLHPLLDKYNAYDYLFTQEFMLSGVGSHIAHPSKAKYKTDIIWAHPGIGKTYALENTLYKDQVMDWDVEFNHRRDAWIAKQSGTIKGTDAFKKARNEYLINWKFHKDFQKFVKGEWKRVKQLANSQNKILVASPHMLLELFQEDFGQVLTMSKDDFVKRGKARGDANPELWKEGIDNTINSLATNPVFLKKLVTINEGTYLADMLDNGSLYNALGQLRENEMQEEAARFLAQHKRNVSYTATMLEFLLGLITGIPTFYNMAMIEDVPANTFTITGDTNENDSFDGATFVNPYVVYWENNSLNSARAGIDKKQFIHFYDDATGTGGIVKTAGFGVTNDRMRRYKFYRDMNYNMTHRNWVNSNGTQYIMKGQGILLDFEGRHVDYGPVYFKQGNTYIERIIERYLGNNTYEVTDRVVDENGAYNGTVNTKQIVTNSNYDVWQMFGGATSMELVNDKLLFSENSIKLTALAANNYGEITSTTGKALTANDVYQPMKHFDIHYMPTKGAVKQGAANINPYSSFFTRESGGLNFMRVRMMLAGIQLDKEHHADNSALSLMTLVISAACSRGLMPLTSNEVYNALYELTKIGTKNFRDELGKLQIGINDSEKFDSAVTDVIIKTILTSTSADGDMMQAIARNIQLRLRQDKVLNFDKAHLSEYDSMIPYSSPEIFRKVVSSLTVAMTKKGIKTKMPGVLSVLCPAHGIVKFYKIPVLNVDGSIAYDQNNKPIYKRVTLEALENEYGIDINDSDALNAKLDELLAQEPTFTDFHDTHIGYRYYIKGTDGTERIVLIARPNSMEDADVPTGYITYLGREIPEYVIGYKDLKSLAAQGIIQNMQEWSRDGQDLNSYDVHFTANKLTYLLGDLDIVLDYFDVKAIKGDNQTAKLIDLLSIYGKQDEFVARIAKDLLGNLKTPKTARLQFNNDMIRAFINAISREEYMGPNTPAIRRSIITSGNYKTNILQALDLLVNDPTIWALDASAFGNNAKKADEVNLAVKIEIRDRLLDVMYSYLNKMGIGFMNRTMQQTLDGISPSNDSTRVKIDGNYVEVDKSSINITAFGIIMPKVFKHNFGLDDFDNIEDIKNDSEFFTRKIVLKFATHVESYPSDVEGGPIVNNFDLELKRNNGDHIYIRINDIHRDADEEISDLANEVTWYKQINPDGTVYRVDKDNNVIYQMFSASDKIYLDRGGNEIIVTSVQLTDVFVDADGNEYSRGQVINNRGKWYLRSDMKKQVEQKTNNPIEFYLNNMGYSTINISEHSHNNVYNYIMDAASRSTSKQAKRFYDRVTTVKKTGETRSIKDLRKLIKNLNDYSGALSDGAELFKDERLAHIAELGLDIRTSFLRSLDLVAARIPSQNQQSFMAMKTAAFDNPDINTAYVSIFLFYLQGSDLDIDAVSLLVFDFDESGLFVGHSPYYSLKNEELRKASESLPFPNGREVEFRTTGKPSLLALMENDLLGFYNTLSTTDNIYNRNAPITIVKDSKGIHLSLNLNTIENIKDFGDILKVLSDGIIVPDDAHINQMLSILNPKVLTTADELRQFENELKQIIDNHNLYIKNSDNIKQERIVKNYVITQLYNIIIDPINLLESWSSVDTVTKPAKALGAKSDKASVQDVFTPGNFMNKFLSVNENMVGKDGIAICATGLKSFFALTQLYQQMLNDPQLLPEADKLLKPVTIGGKTYKGLANAFSKRFLSVFENPNATNEDLSNEMLDFLFEQLWASDAANEMSALLGLSTDNAKELILAKINAGTATLGMYLYGMAVGVPMNDLYNIINSPLGRRLVELTKGDYFNEDSGTRNIIGALDYLRNEPKLHRFDQITSEETFTKPSLAIIKELYDYYHADEKNQKSFTPIKDFIEKGEFDKALNTIRNNAYKYSGVFKDVGKLKEYLAMYNRAIDFLKQYNSDLQLVKNYALATYNTIYGTLWVYNDLETLALGAEEMKTIGKVLHLNLEIYTTPDKLIDQVQTIEGFILTRMRLLNKQAKRNEKPKKDWLHDDSDIAYVNLEELMTNPEKAKEYIDKYDSVMLSFNIFRVITQDPHYRGYVESLLTAHKGLSKKSVKYNIIANRASAFIKLKHVSDPNLKVKVIKNAENAVDLFFRETWMQQYKAPNSKKLKFTMAASTDEKPMYAFIDSAEKATLAKSKVPMQLGTVLGDANYMLWMEKVVIPELKQKYQDNKFIQGLKPVIAGTSDLGIKVIHQGLPINMLPKRGDEYALDIFNQYKEAFNATYGIYTDAAGVDWNIKDMLYYYSLIAYKGKQGPQSLHGIFQDYEGDAVLSYRNFISEADQGDRSYDTINKFITDDMLIPTGSPYRGGSDVLKYMDKKTETPYIIEKPEKQDNEDYDPVGETGEDEVWYGDYQARLYDGIPSGANYNYFTYVQPVEFAKSKLKTKLEINPTLQIKDEAKEKLYTYTNPYGGATYTISYKNGKYRLKSIDASTSNNPSILPELDMIVEYLKDVDIPVITTPNGQIAINNDLFKQIIENMKNDCAPF